MNSGLISQRYAKALLDYAQANKLDEKLYFEAKTVLNSFRHAPQLRAVLASPFVSQEEKKNILLLLTGAEYSKALERLVALLIEKQREESLERIMLAYIALYRKQNRIHALRLTTASDLDEATKERLLDRIGQVLGGKLEVESSVDPEILGGFVFEADSLRWDASLSRQLANIRKEYTLNNSKSL